MTDEIIARAKENGVKMAVVPIACLADIKRDIESVKADNELNGFQKWITMEQYVLDPPTCDFPVRSIVMLVSPYAMVKLRFHYLGKTATDIVEYPAFDAPALVGAWVAEAGYHMEYVHWLPQKRLAVRSGLCEYGRNNITFSEEYGSFHVLHSFVSDLPPEEYTWREVKNMDLCASCGACIRHCPTGAILPDRFLIDNERCLTHQNEWGTHEFPDWVPASAHHRLTGCLKCQIVCPKNEHVFKAITETVDISEEEMAYLLTADKPAQAPNGLDERLKRYGVDCRFESIPRNLKAMLDNIGA